FSTLFRSRAGAVVGLAHLVVHAGVEEDALGRGGLAGINVSHDADIADLVQVAEHFECHGLVPFWRMEAGGAAGAWRWGPSRRTDPTMRSPAVVSEGPVGLGHLVSVLAALDSGTEAVGGVEDLVHQTLGHAVLATGTRVADEPAQREGGGTTG